MNGRYTTAEREHVGRVKELACSVCDALGPSEAHHIRQGLHYTCVALCIDCHRGQILGWHGQKAAWRVRKMDELDALAVTVENEIGQDEFALKALQVAEEEIRYVAKSTSNTISKTLESILAQIDVLKAKLDTFRQYDSYRISQALELEYTFESNRIEGNTMTLRETDLVINEGLTISGKSMREHLEAINHQEAIAFIKDLMKKNTSLIEREVLSIHNLILRGIHPEDAGRYRKVQVMIKGSAHMPPQPFLVAKEMEDFFIWYETNKNKLHPIVLAAEMHERLVTIHPFIDGNGRTSRLVMNLILLQHGYVIANIKGDYDSRMSYYKALETAQTQNNKEEFILFVAQIEKESLERYLAIIGQ